MEPLPEWAIQQAAEALFVQGDPEAEIVTWEHATDDARRLCVGLAETALSAVLVPRPCTTCGGTGLRLTEHYEGTDHAGFIPCGRCDKGTIWVLKKEPSYSEKT